MKTEKGEAEANLPDLHSKICTESIKEHLVVVVGHFRREQTCCSC
jgi:hypothetical protein